MRLICGCVMIVSMVLFAASASQCEFDVQAQTRQAEHAKLDPRIVLLREYAAKHHIRWRIFCASTESSEAYLGWAVQPGARCTALKEEGATDGGLTEECPDQASTAEALSSRIQSRPNDLA